MNFPVLRVVGGVLLVLAGLGAYLGVSIGASAALLLVLGGLVVVVVAVLGHRPRPWDVAIFIIGILALGVVSTGYTTGPQLVTYSAARSQVHSGAISLAVTSVTGSVSVSLTNRIDVAYQVNFSTPAGLFFFGGPGANTVTNTTTNGVFNLKVGSTWSGVSVLLGRGYSFDVKVTTSTGSIDLEAPGAQALRNVSLYSSTGSVNAVVDSSGLTGLVLRADLGSINLVSHHLGASGSRIPITLSASTGSVSMSVSLASQDAVSLTASTTIGSISQSLTGFSITQYPGHNLAANAGDIASAPNSFVITVTATLGSVDLTAGFV
jgi:hypothetical protein